MTETTTKAARGSRWRRVKLFALLGVLLMLVVYTATDVLAGRSLDAELARLEPQHGNLRVRTFAAPSVAAAENRARLVRAAVSLAMPASPAAQTALRRFLTASDSEVVPPELRAFVEENRDALQLAARFGTRAKTSWDIDYGGGYLPFSELQDLSTILYLNSLVELEARRPDEAARMLAIGLAASSSLNNEPQLIAQLIRMGLADRHVMAVRRLLMQSEPSKPALENLAHWLKENRGDPSRIGLEAELAYGSTTMMKMEEGRADLLGTQFPGSRLVLRISRPFVRLAHVRYLQGMDRLITIQAGPRPRPAWEPPKASPWSPYDHFVAGTFASILPRTIETGDDYLSTLGAAEIAVALRRYKLDHASYPADLSALTPLYLDRLPVNPYTGQVPVYVRDGEGFVLQAPRDETRLHSQPAQDWKIAK